MSLKLFNVFIIVQRFDSQGVRVVVQACLVTDDELNYFFAYGGDL